MLVSSTIMSATRTNSWSVLLTARLRESSISIRAKASNLLKASNLAQNGRGAMCHGQSCRVSTLEFQPCPLPRIRSLPVFVVCLLSWPRPCGSSSKSNLMLATSPHSGSAHFANSSHLAMNHLVWNVAGRSKQLKVRKSCQAPPGLSNCDRTQKPLISYHFA